MYYRTLACIIASSNALVLLPPPDPALQEPKLLTNHKCPTALTARLYQSIYFACSGIYSHKLIPRTEEARYIAVLKMRRIWDEHACAYSTDVGIVNSHDWEVKSEMGKLRENRVNGK